MMNIIINVGPKGGRFIKMCLDSLVMQTVTKWRAIVTCDPDDTATSTKERFASYCATMVAVESLPFNVRDKFKVKSPEERMFVVRNFYDSVQGLDALKSDIIVTLDGDDFFARADALAIIQDAYDAEDCWMTYGSFISNRRGYAGGGAYPPRGYKEGDSVRKMPWLASHPRTFKKALFDRVSVDHMKDDDGEWFKCCPDLSIAMPALEMAGPRAHFIKDILVFYNRENEMAVADVMKKEKNRVDAIIRARTAYKRLENLSFFG